MQCPLCNSTAAYFNTYNTRIYNRCTSCASVFLDTRDLPDAQDEKQRYDLHENNFQNEGYIKFLSPLINADEIKNLHKKDDFIICCEGIEHFHSPANEFKRLKSLLKASGRLYCKTKLLDKTIDFKMWSYKNDFTHSFFYTRLALKQIKKSLGFSELIIHQDFFTLKA